MSPSATLSLFSAGVANGWNSPSIPILVAPDSPIPMTPNEGSWLIQVAVLGLLITSYPASWMTDRCVCVSLVLPINIYFLALQKVEFDWKKDEFDLQN